jgi:Ca2+ transporting ATPase
VLNQAGKMVERSVLSKNKCLTELTHVATLCNDSKIVYDVIRDKYEKIGEPTEAALKVAVEKIGTDCPVFNNSIPYLTAKSLANFTENEKVRRACMVDDKICSLYTRSITMEFSRDRKSMSVVVEREAPVPAAYFTRSATTTSTVKSLFVKGAPEDMLERCSFVRTNSAYDKPVPITKAIKAMILKKVEEWGEGESLRVLAFATVDKPNVPDLPDSKNYAKYESGMVFVGLMAMLDPPRQEVRESIARCYEAGIKVIVITGDNKKTAESVCRSIGVFHDGQDLTGMSYTGREWDAMPDKEKMEVSSRALLFSRTEPTHKSQLVDFLKRQGLVVAMTGDGSIVT